MTSQAQTIDDNVSRMIGLIEDLILIIEAENHELESGLPAAFAGATGLKGALSAELEMWVDKVRANQLVLDWATPELREKLSRRAGVLDHLVQENMGRLKAGIDATRYRVDAIMRAIREQSVREVSYDALGRRAATSPQHSGLLA